MRASPLTRRWGPAAVGFIAAGLLVTGVLAAVYVGQASWEKRSALVESQTCHTVHLDADSGGNFRACNVTVAVVSPSGHSVHTTLTGIPESRIHGGRVTVYFSSHSASAVTNPEQYIPLWAFILLAALTWLLVGPLAYVAAWHRSSESTRSLDERLAKLRITG